MAKLTKSTVFKTTETRPETPMEKTTRAVTKIIDGETEKRQIKTARLRKVRLKAEADSTEKAAPPERKSAHKNHPSKPPNKFALRYHGRSAT